MLQELLAKRDDFSSKERKQLCGQVSGALARAANIGRADKLKNILQYMKIEKLKIHDHEIEVDRAFLQKMIALRNKTFQMCIRDRCNLFKNTMPHQITTIEYCYRCVEETGY